MAPVAISDDWVYARAVQVLIREHRLDVDDLSASTLVVQALWGGLFSQLFGFTFGVLRASTVVVTAIAGGAAYGLSREIGLSRARASATAAAVLFNPLVFVLAHTFMTDMHFIAWMLLATWAYARGAARDDARWVAVGSVLAAVAVLVRQQGILVAAAVAVVILLSRRGDASSRRRLAAYALAAPVVTTLAYYIAMTAGSGLPAAQRQFVRGLQDAGPGGLLMMAWRFPYILVIAIGLAALPLLAGLTRLRTVVPTMLSHRPTAVSLFAGLQAVEIALAKFASEGRLVPLSPHFATDAGLGPEDLIGPRPQLLSPSLKYVLTISAVVGAVAFAVSQVRAWTPAHRPAGWARSGWRDAEPVHVVGAVALSQVLGAIPISFLFLRFGNLTTLDRYLLPTAVLALLLFVWATRDIEVHWGLLWGAVVLVGSLSVVATRDYLVYESGVWNVARELRDSGIPLDKMDAGPGWDGWHLSDGRFMQEAPRAPNSPWWVYLYAPRTDLTYVVSNLRGLDGYRLIRTVPYDSMLQTKPTELFVHQRLTPG
ncbi:MAG TPA: glycosyltransferase family 39 protein [Acidimicrobiales bacterium]|nr:glycosyltransferase family 39 protein [Acidimicrobiales bacterium]